MLYVLSSKRDMTAYIKSKKFNTGGHDRGLAVLSVLVVSAVVCLLIFYLFQINNLVACSYEIREQKKLLGELETRNQEMESQIAQWRSPANLENLVQSMGMVEAKEIVYLKNEKTVAVKD